jgi:long-subunit acyl-CoA synthetase (AMP-forming)
MPSADTLPAAAARATHRSDAGVVVDGTATTGWRTVGARARHLALGLSATGIGPGCRVDVALPPSVDAAVADLAVTSTGATLGLGRAEDDGRLLRITADGLTGPAGTASVEALSARGAESDEAEPNRFERLVASIDPSAVLVDERGPGDTRLRLDHRGASDVIASLGRALVGPPQDGVVRVLVDGPWSTAADRLLGLWWPLISGASTCVGSAPTFPRRLVAARATVVVASGAAWGEVAAELRAAPRLRAGSRLERLTLGTGRAAVAGEPVGRLASAARRVAAAAVVPGVLADLGLGSCTRALAVGPLDESARRDLLAAGVPLSSVWLPEGAAMPVTMTEPGSPDRSAGRPLPGWRVAVDDGGAVVADGPARSARPTGRRGRIDDGGHLWLRETRT